jgi:beta-carotene 3-hydroxylase
VRPWLLAVGGFVAMEGVSYALHRWVMHGVGIVWHRSHHEPVTGRFERNDRFPLVFSALGVTLFALGSGPIPALWWVAAGVTAYGIAYLVVHELFIHRRLPVPIPRWRYFDWLRDAHREHHVAGGEPFGMLLPLGRRRQGPDRADPGGGPSAGPAGGRDVLDRSPPVEAVARLTTRSSRARL